MASRSRKTPAAPVAKAPRAPKAPTPGAPYVPTPEEVEAMDRVKRYDLAKAEAAALKAWQANPVGDRPATPVLDVMNGTDYAKRRDAAQAAKALGTTATPEGRSAGARKAWETRKANAEAKAKLAPSVTPAASKAPTARKAKASTAKPAAKPRARTRQAAAA
jgi:hypothetical protein